MRKGLALRSGAMVALLILGGCAGFTRAVGGGKNPPDEFAVTTKAPLVVPPDYALRPPRPGETRPEELSASERARQVLMGDASGVAPTPGEQYLLRKANAMTADPNIRALLDAENGDRAQKDRSFANQIMFWKFVEGKVDDSAAPLRVDKNGWPSASARSKRRSARTRKSSSRRTRRPSGCREYSRPLARFGNARCAAV
jgi:hypothetical protein